MYVQIHIRIDEQVGRWVDGYMYGLMDRDGWCGWIDR